MERLEHGRVAEETREPDEKFLEQEFRLVAAGAQVLDVFTDVSDAKSLWRRRGNRSVRVDGLRQSFLNITVVSLTSR